MSKQVALQFISQAKKDLQSLIYAAPEYKQMWYEALVADLDMIEMSLTTNE
jgi:hypothetical protein